jgi:signal recognition particle GTPase
LLVGADVYRPAAMDQLATLGRQLDLPVFLQPGEKDVLKIARAALGPRALWGAVLVAAGAVLVVW